MRVLLITQGLSRIVTPLMASRHQIVGVTESAPRGFRHRRQLYRLLFGVRNLLARLGIGKQTLANFCHAHGLPYRLDGVFDAATRDWMAALSPDIIVIFSMSQLLKPHILSVAPQGVVNLHPSYLPAYRGPNPDFWQYVDMELNPGVTVHQVDEGEDSGAILTQDRVSIPLGIRSPERLDLLIGRGSELMISTLDAIEEGRANPVPQPVDSPTPRARNLKADEHRQIIQWQDWSIERIWHVLRGTEFWFQPIDLPYGGAKGQYWDIGKIDKKPNALHPPSTIFRDGGRYYLACRDGTIELHSKFRLKRYLTGLLK
jgi:methionyl-tRNA formyltransferase